MTTRRVRLMTRGTAIALGLAAALAASACSSGAATKPSGAGGNRGGAGGNLGTGGTVATGAGGNANSPGNTDARDGAAADAKPDGPTDNDPPFAATCEPSATPLHPGAPILTLTVEPTLGGRPLVLGEPVEANGGRAQISSLRWFISHVVLTRRGAPPVLAELVDAAAAVRPHGVQLLEVDKPETLVLRVRAPAGAYDELGLRIGLPPSCNTGALSRAEFPLDADGGMSWIWTLGYISFRIEGRTESAMGERVLMAHGGVFPPDRPPPRVAVETAVTVPATGKLRLRLDDVIAGLGEGGHLADGFTMVERFYGRRDVLSLEVTR